MKLTEEQREQVTAAKGAGRTSIVSKATAEQAAASRAAAAEEDSLKEETVAGLRRRREAEQEPGVFGDLRRAISLRLVAEHRQGRPPSTEPLGIDAHRLEEFREGVASLSPDELRRLIDTLGLQLVQTIPPARQTV